MKILFISGVSGEDFGGSTLGRWDRTSPILTLEIIILCRNFWANPGLYPSAICQLIFPPWTSAARSSHCWNLRMDPGSWEPGRMSGGPVVWQWAQSYLTSRDPGAGGSVWAKHRQVCLSLPHT